MVRDSVILLQNMVHSTFQHPPPHKSHTVCKYILYIGKGGRGEGGGVRSERRYSRGAIVHKYSSFVHGGNRSQAGSKIPSMVKCISSL